MHPAKRQKVLASIVQNAVLVGENAPYILQHSPINAKRKPKVIWKNVVVRAPNFRILLFAFTMEKREKINPVKNAKMTNDPTAFP